MGRLSTGNALTGNEKLPPQKFRIAVLARTGLRPIASALAAENLRLGRVVVADCVNPVLASRDGWRQTAMQSSARIAEIEATCSDVALHRQRAEVRTSDIAGLKLPTWQNIVGRHYEPWDRDHLVLDTAHDSIDRLLERVEIYLRDGIG